MIGVVVRVQHRIEMPDLVPQALLPKVGRGVDQDIGALILNQDRRPQALVFGMVRLAHLAGTAQGWDACGGTGTEKQDIHDCCQASRVIF